MDNVLALQYIRGSRRLQLIVMPYSFNISGAALFRFLNPDSEWRIVPIVGMEMTLKISGLPDFDADAAMKEVFETPWFASKGLALEAKGLVDTSSWDFSDLVGDRVPRDLITRIHEQVDSWA